ncbi:uncharacterized protein LOC130640791 [Hydractinia symbiolongicarpus]|uniref:uncharacterized protein LOC130640791 n=1 Tax=Hydractinia symbiolongicarpus TaxID=13093 RepID=UPI00254FE935|nr:uncharacterized protein LOC130640791 [Hydractinia symbiolongicarpus]XP_057303328.1 uncharacterized protein LOC130640791 [Hydractinia symbiolongicarpus]
MACCFRMLQYIIALMLLAAIGLLVTAACVDYWWKLEITGMESGNKGLWRTCLPKVVGTNSKTCSQRDDIFQFSQHKNLDMVLATLCGGGVCYIISVVLIFITICQKYPTKCFILVEAIVTFLGVGACAFSVTWAILEIQDENLNWAFYLLYAAGGLGVLTFFFSLVLLCMRAPGAYHSTRRDDEIIMLSR